MRLILLVLFAFLLIGSGSAQCDIPTLNDITPNFKSEVANIQGDGNVIANLLNYKFTCKAISALDKFRFVSVAVNYTVGTADPVPEYGRFEMECKMSGSILGWQSTNEWTVEDETVFAVETQDNCYRCRRLPDQEAHCEECHDDCSAVGSGACTGVDSDQCCPYFAVDGSCTESCPDNYTPNDIFQCDCSKSCETGYERNDSCICIATHICLINNPCQNNGSCNITSETEYTCECTDDYDGVDCTGCSKSCEDGYEADINCECVLSNICIADNPCLNEGTCTLYTKPDDYQCDCKQYYNGTNCTECTLECQNGGSRDTCMCICDVGYTGDTCDMEIDYCENNPCGFYGDCTNRKEGYTCACVEGWTGSDCNECSIQYCTECTGSPPVCKTCDENYVISSSGKSCELEDLCPLMPCQNGGTCSRKPGSYECSCPDTWTGVNCTQCSDGYGMRNEQCVVCDDNNCLVCDEDYLVCKDCDRKYSRSSKGECIRDSPPTQILIWIIIGSVIGFLFLVALLVIIVMGFLRCANKANERNKYRSTTTKNPVVSENPLYISQEELEKEGTNI